MLALHLTSERQTLAAIILSVPDAVPRLCIKKEPGTVCPIPDSPPARARPVPATDADDVAAALPPASMDAGAGGAVMKEPPPEGREALTIEGGGGPW